MEEFADSSGDEVMFGTEGSQEPAEQDEEGFEGDHKRLSARQKQVDYGKNTKGYENYLRAVPKERRRKYGPLHDPPTPDITKKHSKKAWDGIVKAWRRHLHKFDDMQFDEPLAEPTAGRFTGTHDGPGGAYQGSGSGPASAAGSGGGSGSARAAKRRRNNKTPGKQQWRTPQLGQQQQDYPVQEGLQLVTDVRQQSDSTPEQEQQRRPLAPHTKNEQQQGQQHGSGGDPFDKGSRDHSRHPTGGHENNRQGKPQPDIKWWEDRGGVEEHSRQDSPYGRRSTRESRDRHDRRAGTDRYSSGDRRDRQGETDRPLGDGRSRMDVKHDRSTDHSSRDRRHDSRYNSSGGGRVEHEQPQRHESRKVEPVDREKLTNRGYAGPQTAQQQHKQQQRQPEAEKQQGSWQHYSTPTGASWADEVDRAEADAAAEFSLSEGEGNPGCGSRDSPPREGRRSTRPSSAQLTPAKRANSQAALDWRPPKALH